MDHRHAFGAQLSVSERKKPSKAGKVGVQSVQSADMDGDLSALRARGWSVRAPP